MVPFGHLDPASAWSAYPAAELPFKRRHARAGTPFDLLGDGLRRAEIPQDEEGGRNVPMPEFAPVTSRW